MVAPPPGTAPAPTVASAPDPGPTTAQVILGAVGAFADGMAAPGRRDKMKNWLTANAASIATCLHGTASSSGSFDILSEDTNTTKARIKWSGTFGAERYTDVLITVGGDYSHPMATVSVAYDDGVWAPDDDCRYLHGVPLE